MWVIVTNAVRAKLLGPDFGQLAELGRRGGLLRAAGAGVPDVGTSNAEFEGQHGVSVRPHHGQMSRRRDADRAPPAMRSVTRHERENLDMNDSEDFDPEQWRDELRSHRAEKDEFFAEHPQSPIPPNERDEFDGLDYFDPDPDYRVATTVEVHDQPEPVEMDVSAGAPQRYLRVATLHFELEGQGDGTDDDEEDKDDEGDGDSYELAGYRQREDGEGLFVPFRDKTTGQQTYRDGRYMEFEAEGELADGDEVPLDFNLAYSPFCAYSETFACPLPPEENWLETEILAGERA
jgi:uncharacterized protein (DUF1684 family)